MQRMRRTIQVPIFYGNTNFIQWIQLDYNVTTPFFTLKWVYASISSPSSPPIFSHAISLITHQGSFSSIPLFSLILHVSFLINLVFFFFKGPRFLHFLPGKWKMSNRVRNWLWLILFYSTLKLTQFVPLVLKSFRFSNPLFIHNSVSCKQICHILYFIYSIVLLLYSHCISVFGMCWELR